MAQVIKLPRQSDGEGLFLHFTGGFRAAKIAEDAWRIEPVLVDDKPCATGPLTMLQLQAIVKQNDFRAVAFHKFGWMDGVYHSSWKPIMPGKSNHSECPSNLWSNIAGNIALTRTKEFFNKIERPSLVEIARVMDEKNTVEALAQYISNSLRSMDFSVEQIAEHYHEQLVNNMSVGHVDGEMSENTLSQTLYAHVHSFFLHLGAARDYFGSLIAHRIGFDSQKVDSMARLVEKIREAHLQNDALLELLFSNGNIAPLPPKNNKFTVSGWMQKVTDTRNELVHKRPYGSRFNERLGRVVPTQKEAGLFRYFRPFELDDNAKQDVFDVLHYHYARFNELMHLAAQASGENTAMMHFTDEDVIALEIRKPGEYDR